MHNIERRVWREARAMTRRGEVPKGNEWDSLKDIFLKKNPFEAPFFGNPALRMVRVKPKRISYTGADMQGFKIEAT